MRRRRRAIDQQGLGRAADAGAAQLGVQHDALRHVERGRLVDIDVADAFEMREHRHARLLLHARRPGSCRRAARCTSMLPSRPASIMPTAARSRVGTSEIAASGRFGLAQALGQRCMDGARRAVAVRAAAQDHGVAGLQRQRAGVGGDVRPAFVDDADDAERHAHALDGHAVRPRPGFGDLADRIGQLADDVEALGHRLDALVVQRQPVEERGGQPAALPSAMSSALAARIFGLAGADRRGHRRERAVLLLGRRKRQHPRGGLRVAADRVHRRGDVGGRLDGFQRSGHDGLVMLDMMISRCL